MSAPQLERLKEIFHAARELEPGQRTAFLDESCGNDRELRREIDALLKSAGDADGFIDNTPAALAAEAFGGVEVPNAVGRTIGQYKLIERIGIGGMGEVYLAERADQQFTMQVAIKLIKRGMDTASVLRRFQHERQILASLEHPNIARLLDGGTTEEGLPYFVMEYIKGKRVDQYAEEKGLSISERLELFRQVCGAVSYAHQRLVVHRDLKPSNILVTSEGVPKLLDFGIAKIIHVEDSSADTFATITAAPLMTPEYASPEQFEGGPATTLSDVYSLGAVLYQLLSGRSPHSAKTRSRQAMAPALERAAIEKPSSAATRPEDARRLRGDLDNIVMMAMRTETARRYRSVEQFSEDIRRHLVGRPVIARADTLSYRGSKFVRRNKIAIAAAFLIVLSLIGGIIATAWQARKATTQEQRARAEQARAERRFNDVRHLANRVLFDYHDAIRTLPGATKVRELLVKDALNYLDSLASEAHGDAALQRELAFAYDRVGDVRGGVSGSLGDMAGAVESYTKALTIRDALIGLDPTYTEARRDAAITHGKIGPLLMDSNQPGKGLEHLRKAVTLCLDATREQPSNKELQLDLANACNKLGDALRKQGDAVGALEQHRAALAICEKRPASDRQDRRFRRLLWASYQGMAYGLFQQRDVAGAIEANHKAQALGEALVAEDPINAVYRAALVASYKSGGHYRSQIDPAAALEYYLKALPLEEAAAAADPADASIRKDLAFTHKRVADFLANQKANSQALLHFSKALESFEKLVASAPGDLNSRFRVATCRIGVAGMRARLGEVDLALQECHKALAELGEIKEDPANAHHRFLRAEAYQYLGYAYGELAAARKASADASRQHMVAARNQFQESLNVLDDLRSRGALDPASENWAKEIAGEVAKCDVALSK